MIDIDSIKDSKDFRTKVFSYKCEDSKITINPSCTVQFKANPDVIIVDEFDLSEFSLVWHVSKMTSIT